VRLALSVPDAAEAIGCSTSMMWKLLERGDIAKVKIGRRTVIRITELERFLSEQDETPAVVAAEASVIATFAAGGDRHE